MRHTNLLAASLALALSACGGEAGNEPSGGTGDGAASGAKTAAASDPCSMISKEDVTAVTGEPVLEAKADGDTCHYTTEDDASSLEVLIKRSGGAEEMDVARSAAGALGAIGNEMKGAEGAEGDTGELLSERASAPAIGDQAFFGANRQLNVLKGDVYFAVSPPTMRSRMSGGNPLLSGEQRREMATAIATKIAAKL